MSPLAALALVVAAAAAGSMLPPVAPLQPHVRPPRCPWPSVCRMALVRPLPLIHASAPCGCRRVCAQAPAVPRAFTFAPRYLAPGVVPCLGPDLSKRWQAGPGRHDHRYLSHPRIANFMRISGQGGLLIGD